jgi:flagellar biosynthetic protein FliQ
MDEQMVVFLIRRTLITALMVVGPLLAVDLVVGLAVAVLQAVTSIREMTLTMIPKILAVTAMLLWLLPWMLKVTVAYSSDMFRWISVLGAR